ncbi:hypothetical protein JL722_13427 [Aureococcus anophagefferens]|nr:hypothetical protein JL722_13427 [Aureococcus anophagefferens]
MAPWRFARPGCAYHYFAPGDAARADGSLLLFVGDSLLRGLYATTVRLGGAASDDKLKAREDAARGKGRAERPRRGRPSTSAARASPTPMWSDAELGAVKAAVGRAAARGQPARVVVVANWGAEHSARFDDATLDGVHYGQTAATMGATVLLNMPPPP